MMVYDFLPASSLSTDCFVFHLWPSQKDRTTTGSHASAVALCRLVFDKMESSGMVPGCEEDPSPRQGVTLLLQSDRIRRFHEDGRIMCRPELSLMSRF